MTYEPTLTATDEPPSVHIEFGSLDPATETITVWRSFSGVKNIVRRGRNRFAAGGFVTDDPEVPTGIPVTYYATMFNAAGDPIADTGQTTITVAAAQSVDYAWFSDPLTEGSAIRVTMSANAGTKVQRPMVGKLFQVGMRTVVLNSRQSDLTDLNMDFYTDTIDELNTVQQLLADTRGLILIRTMPPMMVPRQLYCWAQNATPDEFDFPAGIEDAEWSNTVQQVSEIEGDTSVLAFPWQVYIDAFPTWADAIAAYSTWFDAKKNPPA